MTSPAYMPLAVNRLHNASLPGALRDDLNDTWDAFAAAVSEAGLTVPANPDFTASMLRVWAGSEFVSGLCVDQPALLYDLLGSGDLLGDYAPGEYLHRLRKRLKGVANATELGRELRAYRQREMLRIAWRDLAGWAPLCEVLDDLSALADASVAMSLDHLGRWAIERHTTGKKKKIDNELVVLGMGKLGACELNFSSDIDLIFAYPEITRSWGRHAISPEEFYLQLGQQLVQVLDTQTEHGFVFRVDMRLRPYGDSGALVANFDALAEYYQMQGREWERYAMIKARPVAGPKKAGRELMKLLKPFVYRRYLDFSAFESLRNLKQQIVREVERKGMRDNIKLGPGGIREIEFIAQAFQLVRGGRQPLLQQRGVLPVLDALAQLGFLPAHTSLQLAEAYQFLRQTENRLQAYADQQVHALPESDGGRLRLAYAMGYPDWEPFAQQLAQHREHVQQHFEQVFAEPATRATESMAETASGLEDVWSGELDAAQTEAALEQAGYGEPKVARQWLQEFRAGPVTRYLGDQGRQRFDELMPRVLQAAAGERDALRVLQRLGELLEAIAGRTTYISLLLESPMALSQLVQLCAASSWVAGQLTQHPILLDELLDPRTLYDPLDKAGLQGQLDVALAGIPANDLEQQMDQLRHFKQAAVLHVAASDIVTGLPLPRVGDSLTWVAETVLERVLQQAWDHLVERHGVPGYMQHGKLRSAHFGIVGYGKLGGLELGYGSDLDIVFLHDSRGNEQHTAGPRVIDNSEFFTRLSQRIIHYLNTYTPAGVLYEVDMRLRPNGASGLLVSSLDAFAEYQRRSAWTWEQQALVRARVVAGGADIVRQFERIRSGVLARPRDAVKLRKEVRDMRYRMRDELDKSTARQVDLKQCRGGIVDIEFMVQCGVLLWSDEHAALLGYTDNLRLLDGFAQAGLMHAAEATQLADAYCAIRQHLNHLALQEQPGTVEPDVLEQHRTAVAYLWDRYMG